MVSFKMKVIVVVALFAFVAVQVCQAAPRPDDDKKEEATGVSAFTPPIHLPEVKSESAGSDATTKKDVTVLVPEDKKE